MDFAGKKLLFTQIVVSGELSTAEKVSAITVLKAISETKCAPLHFTLIRAANF